MGHCIILTLVILSQSLSGVRLSPLNKYEGSEMALSNPVLIRPEDFLSASNPPDEVAVMIKIIGAKATSALMNYSRCIGLANQRE
jgi:hypothetical protein